MRLLFKRTPFSKKTLCWDLNQRSVEAEAGSKNDGLLCGGSEQAQEEHVKERLSGHTFGTLWTSFPAKVLQTLLWERASCPPRLPLLTSCRLASLSPGALWFLWSPLVCLAKRDITYWCHEVRATTGLCRCAEGGWCMRGWGASPGLIKADGDMRFSSSLPLTSFTHFNATGWITWVQLISPSLQKVF